jgi:pilus assembly protein CpaB
LEAEEEEEMAEEVIPEEGVGAPAEGEEQALPPPPPQPDIVTLIVTPQDALALNWAMKSGVDIILTLRAPGDTTITDTMSVNLQYLIENYNITVPAKLPYGIEPAPKQPIVPILPNDIVPEEE